MVMETHNTTILRRYKRAKHLPQATFIRLYFCVKLEYGTSVAGQPLSYLQGEFEVGPLS
jgi:hypothetical protein